MRHSRGRVVEVRTRAELDARLARGARDLEGWRCRSVDLAGLDLSDVRVAGAMFLGCRMADGLVEDLRGRGAVVFGALPEVALDPARGRLYTAYELYGDGRYHDSLDARVYAWCQDLDQQAPDAALAATLHDHGVDRALASWVAGRSVVGVMGGHSVRRGEPAYDRAARLGHALGATLTVATGGGPGAMEAANLGAALAGAPAASLERALVHLAGVPDFDRHIGAWARAGFTVLDGLAADGITPTASLGVPTWHYGHEPPNVFATAIAKYVRNAVREAVLLEICGAGIIFLPGAAGTVQEVFQDACENYYADPSGVAPMVLLGRRYWTEELPVWPLLQRLGEGRDMGAHLHLVDSVEDAVAVVRSQASEAAS